MFISTWNCIAVPIYGKIPKRTTRDAMGSSLQAFRLKAGEATIPTNYGLYPNEMASDFAFLPFGGRGA
jgi:hypothetical protein